jgi:YfiH family protein
MHVPDPFYALDEHIAIDLPGARAVFTTRRGGHSRGVYASLNLGRLTDDNSEHVEANQRDLEARLGVKIARCRQVHGTEVVPASAAASEPPEADGQITTTRGVAPMVLTADCLPIVISAPDGVAVLHAGWRGLAGGIVARGAQALREAGAGEPVAAAIGPGVGGCCYEVGPDVHAAFAGYGDDVHDGGRIDLKAIAAQALARAGVAQVHDVGLCTMCSDSSLFFSHRRDRGITGRQAGLAWLS